MKSMPFHPPTMDQAFAFASALTGKRPSNCGRCRMAMTSAMKAVTAIWHLASTP